MELKMQKKEFNKTYLLLFLIMMFGLFQILMASDYELVWEENFDSTGLSADRWQSVNKGDGFGNNEKQYYTDRSENLYFQDGKLVIRANKEYYAGPKNSRNYTAAKIQTKDKVNFKYKSIRIRAKLPAGTGTWPAIWMLGSNIDEVSWPACGEIDIMEHVGYNPGHIHGTIHTEAYNGMNGTQKGGSITIPGFSEEYHVYRIDWYNNKIEWYVDDQQYYTYHREENADFRSWPFDQGFYLILNLAIGGDWGGAEGIDDTIFPVEFRVDWVKVYDMPILELDSYEKNIKLLDENEPGEKSDTLAIYNLGSGELEPVSIENSENWLTFEWLAHSGNEQQVKISPSNNAKKLLPGKYETTLTIGSANSNKLRCKVELQVGKNLVLDKKATASSYLSNPIFRNQNKPQNAVDGNFATKWQSDGENIEWLQIDMEDNYKLNMVQIYWLNEISTIYGYKYELQLSSDSTFSDYSIIESQNYSRGGAETIVTDSTTSGRYLRFYGLKSGDFNRYSIQELEVYGREAKSTDIFRNSNLPTEFEIKNYPNPFNPNTTIEYALPEAGFVDLSIYNIYGQKITSLVMGNEPAGNYKLQWHATDLSSGFYFYRLMVSGRLIKTKKMILLK